MVSVAVVKSVKEKYAALCGALDERTRRLWAASEAMALGHGGIAAVSQATGLAESTIHAGRRELQQKNSLDSDVISSRRVRRACGGRKKLIEHDPKLL